MAINEKHTEYKFFFNIFNTFTHVLKCVTIFIEMLIVNYGFGNVEL